MLDEEGNEMLNPDGTTMMTTRIVELPRDISDQYDPIPEPVDLSEEPLTPELAEEIEENEGDITLDVINKLMMEFDPQGSPTSRTTSGSSIEGSTSCISPSVPQKGMPPRRNKSRNHKWRLRHD